MSIILEGPDGAGKTTLASDLQAHFPGMEMHPRFCTSVGGPIDGLAEAVYKDARARPTHFIYDRHPVISDYVYNASIPGRRFSPEFLTIAMGRVRERVAKSSFTIFCLPPFMSVLRNVERDREEQMPGVRENIELIYNLYHMHYLMWPGRKLLYDYTNHSKSWESLIFALKDTRGTLWLPTPK
jgi:hypothetical protein